MRIIPLGIWGAYPKADEANSAFLLEEDGFRCLVDCGSGVLSKLQQYIAVEDLDAVVLTHYHPDHDADIGVLQHAILVQTALENRKEPLPIYGHTKNKVKFESLGYKEYTYAKAITEDNQIDIGPWKVSFCETNHTTDCLALKFKSGDRSVAFTGDTAWSDKLISFARDVDVLISEASMYDYLVDVIPGHLSGRQAGKLAVESGAGRLLLTHLPQYGEPEDLVVEAQENFQGDVELAVVGKTY